MRTYKIFLAHPSDYPKEDIDAIYAACTRASGSVLFKPTEWSDGLCDNSKTQNTLLYNDLKSSDIIFRLLYKKYKDGCGTQMEYDFAKEKGKTILTFIRVDSSEESKQLVNALRQSEGDNTGTICEYPTKEFPDLGQSVEVQLGRFLRRQKKRWWIPVAGILTGILLFLLIFHDKLPWPGQNNSEPGTPITDENDTVVVTDSTVSASIKSGSKGEKRENNVKSDIAKRDPGKAGAKEGPSGNNAKAVIDSNAFFIIANDPLPTSFRAGVSKGIRNQISSLHQSDAKDNVRWVITVTEDPSITEQPKTRETQEDIVTLKFTVEINDATGLTHTYSVSFEHNDNHWGREAAINAARQSSIPRIVKLITEHIK